MGTRSWALPQCESGRGLPTSVDQVLDHDRLGVDCKNISGHNKSSLQTTQSLWLGNVSLDLVGDKGSANHLLLSPIDERRIDEKYGHWQDMKTWRELQPNLR